MSMPEYGCAALGAGSGLTVNGDGIAGDPGANGTGDGITSCPTPLLPANVPALLGPGG